MAAKKENKIRQLDPKLRELYAAIRQFMRDKGFSPSVRELAEEVDASPTMVSIRLRKLEGAGVIVRGRRIARSISLAEA